MRATPAPPSDLARHRKCRPSDPRGNPRTVICPFRATASRGRPWSTTTSTPQRLPISRSFIPSPPGRGQGRAAPTAAGTTHPVSTFSARARRILHSMSSPSRVFVASLMTISPVAAGAPLPAMLWHAGTVGPAGARAAPDRGPPSRAGPFDTHSGHRLEAVASSAPAARVDGPRRAPPRGVGPAWKIPSPRRRVSFTSPAVLDDLVETAEVPLDIRPVGRGRPRTGGGR